MSNPSDSDTLPSSSPLTLAIVEAAAAVEAKSYAALVDEIVNVHLPDLAGARQDYLGSCFVLADTLADAKAAYEAEHPETRHGARNPKKTPSFTSKASADLGKSVSWVEKYIRISTIDIEDRAKLAGQEPEFTFVLALAKEPSPEVRSEAIEVMRAKGPKNAKALLKAKATKTPTSKVKSKTRKPTADSDDTSTFSLKVGARKVMRIAGVRFGITLKDIHQDRVTFSINAPKRQVVAR